MSQLIEETIDHLDFEVNEDDFHFKHPTDPDKYWCGRDAHEKGRPYSSEFVCRPEELDDKIRCKECRDLSLTKNWWAIHNKHFGSKCHAMFGWNSHNCNA